MSTDSTLLNSLYGSSMLMRRLRERVPSVNSIIVTTLAGYKLHWHKVSKDDTTPQTLTPQSCHALDTRPLLSQGSRSMGFPRHTSAPSKRRLPRSMLMHYEPRRTSPLRMPANQSINRTPSGAAYFQHYALITHHRDLVQYLKLISFENLQVE